MLSRHAVGMVSALKVPATGAGVRHRQAATAGRFQNLGDAAQNTRGMTCHLQQTPLPSVRCVANSGMPPARGYSSSGSKLSPNLLLRPIPPHQSYAEVNKEIYTEDGDVHILYGPAFSCMLRCGSALAKSLPTGRITLDAFRQSQSLSQAEGLKRTTS